jgi:hypothetical protein
MVAGLTPRCDAYVECVTRRGLPQRLVDREGKPTTVMHSYNLLNPEVRTETHNNYYPSPEMHEDAANALEPICRRLLGAAQPK